MINYFEGLSGIYYALKFKIKKFKITFEIQKYFIKIIFLNSYSIFGNSTIVLRVSAVDSLNFYFSIVFKSIFGLFYKTPSSIYIEIKSYLT